MFKNTDLPAQLPVQMLIVVKFLSNAYLPSLNLADNLQNAQFFYQH